MGVPQLECIQGVTWPENGDRPDVHGPGTGRGPGHGLKHMTLVGGVT